MAGPVRVGRLRSVVWLVVFALLATGGCAALGTDEPDGVYVVSYSGAAQRLTALDALEAEDQVRDWARLGLASSLGLDRDRLVDALYDTTPIRDPAFADLVEQPIGSGRALFDGTTLHLLVPEDDPNRSRTIGLLLDEHRVDAGVDPAQVQVHRYRTRPENQTVELSAEPAAPTGEVRTDNGWTEARVDQAQGLDDFLADTSNLARLELRGPEIWAGGWRWPGSAQARVTPADVSALQRGYLGQTLPGFSLDPGPPTTLDDIRAAIPDLAPDLAARVSTGDLAGSGFASADELAELVDGTLFRNQPPADTLPARGLPADRTQLWALSNLLEGGAVYSQARYDGGLAGTEVGMTLFYTDFVAKDWTNGVGDGVPTNAVPGFVPDLQAAIPPGLCPRPGDPLSESGRLWFGQNDTGFAFESDAVGIGAQATRLFSRSDGAGGAEVEPSFGFGRGLRWWDQHYQAVADHEPQYHRLEQLMRWSGALEWLTSSRRGQLPQLPDSEIRADLTFADWYRAHDELRERKPLILVTPPSANEEAVLPTPSATADQCDRRGISGGVSLADGLARTRDLGLDTADLPAGLRRAGPTDPATTSFDPATRSGQVDRVTIGVADGLPQITERVTQTVRSDPGAASVEATGAPRRSLPIGEARLRGEEGRSHETVFRSDGRNVMYDVNLQGQTLGRVEAVVPPSSGVLQTDIILRPSVLQRMLDAFPSIRKDPARGLETVPGFRYSYPTRPGQTVSRLDVSWIEVTEPGSGPSSLRTNFVAEVRTEAGGIAEVRAGVPEQLAPADQAALEITQGPVVTRNGDLPGQIPPDTPIYLGSLVGSERPGALPAPIGSDALVSFRIAGPPTGGDPAGPVTGEGKSWSLVGLSGGAGGAGGGGGGGGAGGAGGAGGGVGVPGGGDLVLVTVCPDPAQAQPGEECEE